LVCAIATAVVANTITGPCSSAHLARIVEYDIETGNLTEVAKHDPDRFGDLNLPGVAPFNPDEESSGIIDASSILGEGWYLLDDQAHYALGGELVEGGQLLAMHIPAGKKFKLLYS
jgi:hypothetical protein